MNFKNRKIKTLSHETMALIEYLVHESIAQVKPMGYRFKVPYSSFVRNDKSNDGIIIIEVKVYYDSEFKEEPDAEPKTYKITNPDKGRH